MRSLRERLTNIQDSVLEGELCCVDSVDTILKEILIRLPRHILDDGSGYGNVNNQAIQDMKDAIGGGK